MTEYLHNQNLTVSVRERVHAGIPSEYWESMVAALSQAVNAVRVGRARRVWSIKKMGEHAALGREVLYESDLGAPDFSRPVMASIDFSSFFQPWEYLV